ncbi:hypothetical protein XELAEV_18021239mg [Xenopus laevis]|uniref:Uncharacterized protein n=1 Tax=Xenopus laevis TaxID=8355 RepID=A0A974HRP1_XENLA|nr:hypothetical protein XELAEV_18021239mg [Xenopus laevis]
MENYMMMPFLVSSNTMGSMRRTISRYLGQDVFKQMISKPLNGVGFAQRKTYFVSTGNTAGFGTLFLYSYEMAKS